MSVSASWPPALAQLHQRLREQTAVVGIVGLGYVGLPLVQAFVAAGYRCLGFDIDPAKIAKLARGESYIGHLSSDWLAGTLAAGTFVPTADLSRLAEPDVLILCVPTPLTAEREPDLQYVAATAEQVAATLRPGQLIILESTTYPGTTRDVVLPRLQRSGLKLGTDFALAYAPEREDPGNPAFATRQIPKVIGGADARSLQLAEALYSPVVAGVVPVRNPETAEATKLLENVYRAVNIALVNELKIVFARLGVDIWEVIAAARTKPFGFQPFYPGPGMGGHCIPVDPFYLSWIAEQHGVAAKFVELAGEINSQMPAFVVQRLEEALHSRQQRLAGSSILILGIAYKRDVDDPRESPAFRILELLQEAGAQIAYHDPHIAKLPAMRHYSLPSLESLPLTAELLQQQTATVIVTDHSAVDYRLVVEHSPLVIDTRNVTLPWRSGCAHVFLA